MRSSTHKSPNVAWVACRTLLTSSRSHLPPVVLSFLTPDPASAMNDICSFHKYVPRTADGEFNNYLETNFCLCQFSSTNEVCRF